MIEMYDITNDRIIRKHPVDARISLGKPDLYRLVKPTDVPSLSFANDVLNSIDKAKTIANTSTVEPEKNDKKEDIIKKEDTTEKKIVETKLNIEEKKKPLKRRIKKTKIKTDDVLE